MSIGGVIGHQIEHELDAHVMKCIEETIEVCELSESRVNGAVIGDVVAEIHVLGRVDRREPDRVHSQPRQVLDALEDAAKVAKAIPGGVAKASGVDLVEDASLPPGWTLWHPQLRSSLHA
jgi:hypothetical protein